MDWLNHNSGAIQALSSILIVGLTAVLAGVTWRYVSLTSRYVELTQALLEVQRETAATRRRELRAHIGILNAFLKGLYSADDERTKKAILSHANPPTDFPFDKFRALASEVSVEAANWAVEAETHITYLINLIHSVRINNPRKEPPRSVNEPLSPTLGAGYDWQHFPSRDYDTAWRFGINALTGLLTEIDATDKRGSPGTR